MSCSIAPTQARERSQRWTLHSSPSPPPGRRTRCASASARSPSNQCQASPHTMASTAASCSGSASACPSSIVAPGMAAASSRRISGTGSTATISAPVRARTSLASFPVPDARSSTRPPGRSARRAASQSTAAFGRGARAYEDGRPSYPEQGLAVLIVVRRPGRTPVAGGWARRPARVGWGPGWRWSASTGRRGGP
jgi:hypothetical protein